MIEIETTKQYRDIPDNDFILLLRKPHSKDKLHKSTCDSFKIRDILLKNAGTTIDPDSVKDTKFERTAIYYHIPSNDKDGKKFIRVKGVRWFTNIDYKERHKDLILYKKYNKDDYPKYENYDAININKTKEIPMDYSGEMGVPITFMDKFNPDQFEIIGMDRPIMKELTGKTTRFHIDNKEIYARIVIKNKRLGKTS